MMRHIHNYLKVVVKQSYFFIIFPLLTLWPNGRIAGVPFFFLLFPQTQYIYKIIETKNKLEQTDGRADKYRYKVTQTSLLVIFPGECSVTCILLYHSLRSLTSSHMVFGVSSDIQKKGVGFVDGRYDKLLIGEGMSWLFPIFIRSPRLNFRSRTFDVKKAQQLFVVKNIVRIHE